MRAALFSLVFAVIACGGGGEDSSTTTTRAPAGPDPVVVRVSRTGGIARAYRFSSLDSTIWRSTQASPPIERILAFDQENGLLAFVDTSGYPGWIDLRLGSVRRPTRGTFVSVASADGWSIYGLSASGSLVRMTPSGDWQSPMAYPVRRVLPTADGTVLLVTERSPNDGLLLRMRPPEESAMDSVELTVAERAVVTPVGDRAYLSAGDQLWSISPNAVTEVQRFVTADPVLAIAPTPSGDRVFLANEGSTRLELLDRYAGNLRNSARLPGLATELRMDPLGRYLLVRPVEGDSVWVVDVGNETLVATIETRWRPDLPAVAFDGTIATWRERDVIFVNPRDGAEAQTIRNGANDIWFFTRWNGFRPRAVGIDQPVAFRTGGDTSFLSSGTPVVTPSPPSNTPPGSTTVAVPPPEPTRPAEPAPRTRGGWILSFAAVLTPERAREIVDRISVNGQRPRVVTSEADGTIVFRVVMGPFPSRDEAERAGRTSGHSFWVYEGGT